MNCSRAQLELALLVGGDLDRSEVPRLKRHVASCGACRAHSARLRSGVRMLHVPAAEAGPVSHDSVWPDVARRLPNRRDAERSRPAGGWVGGLACAAIVLAAVSLVNDFRLQRRVDDEALPVLEATYRAMDADLGPASPVPLDTEPALFVSEPADVPESFETSPEFREDLFRKMRVPRDPSRRSVVYGSQPVVPEPFRAGLLFP